MIDQLLGRYDAKLDPRPHFFYCIRDQAQAERADPERVLASIARQMCCLEDNGPILEPAVKLYNRKKDKGPRSTTPTLDESVDLIINLAAARPVTYIVVDALDECVPETRGALLSGLKKIIDDASTLVKVFVSSREEVDIMLHLRAMQPHISISASQTKTDVERFVNEGVEKCAQVDLLFGEATTTLLEDIKESLSKGAMGMYVATSYNP